MRTYATGRRRVSGSRTSSLIGVIVLVWLLIGVVAGAQRDYYDSAPTNCASTGTIALTIIAGPLNYLGANPKADCNVEVPQPSE
ncbi:hypothetical protein [Nocardia bovistercoris]|uniref:Uncharacterized protein n=1 Tax=Nocardia bovistercoris TaxID=2785916 RepID=A0A931IHF3_9NOCA|nr:hypothetical protein [Nocardia bovistercoris]MBH0780436.1 hypothetical protein [Nocardia bovistercoris]